jgi:hypothetical protein
VLTRSVRGYACRVIILASWLWRAVLGLLLLVAIAGTVRASDGSRIAFVVGNANYVEAVALKNPINDAAAMVSLFQRSGFMVEEINDLKTTEVATLRQKIDQIDRGSVVFFYYAGHGVQLDGRNYLLPVDVPTNRPDSMTDASLYLGDVLAAIEKRSPKLAVVVLDASRDDPFGTKANDIAKGLARVDPPASTVVFYATRPGGVAADGEGANGLFTSALIQVATQETTPIEVLFRRVSKSVYEKSQGEQEPWVEGVIREEFALSKPVERDSSDPPNDGPGVAVAAAEPSATPSEPSVIASESVTVTPNRTNFVTKAVAFKQLAGLAAAGRLDKDKTYYLCDGDTCQPYEQWSVTLKNSANVRSLKNETNFFDRVDSSRMCAWSFEEGRCEKDQVEFTIVNPLAMFNKGFFQGYDISEVTRSRSGGVNFRADTRAGSIWFGSKRNYVNCKQVDGRIESLNRRTAMEIASAACMGVLPSTTKTTISVLMVDLDAGEMIVAYDFTMFAGLAGAASSGFAQITFGEHLK